MTAAAEIQANNLHQFGISNKIEVNPVKVKGLTTGPDMLVDQRLHGVSGNMHCHVLIKSLRHS